MTDNLQKNLCQNFCAYFKPSKKKNLACKGFLIVEALLKKKKIHFDKIDKAYDAIHAVNLKEKMCITCSFFESDCDFAEDMKGASPCGGFIFLVHLLEKGIINIDDIQDIV